AAGDTTRDRAGGADRLRDETAEPLGQPEQCADGDRRDEQRPEPDRALGAPRRGECGGERLAIQHPPGPPPSLVGGYADHQLVLATDCRVVRGVRFRAERDPIPIGGGLEEQSWIMCVMMVESRCY